MTQSPAPNQSSAPEAAFDHLPKYRTPREDRQSLVTPSLVDSIGQLKRTPADPVASQLTFGSWRLDRVREVARREAISAAIDHTRAYRDLWFNASEFQTRSASAPWVVAGHQPELFHPGVWFKNFLLSQAAQHTGIVPLNLIIDNDLCRSPAIRVLTRGPQGSDPLRTESVPFDAPAAAVAWECRPLADLSTFNSFPKRVRQTLVSDVADPLVDRLWHYARIAGRRTGRLGLAIAEARHALEGEVGLQTLELPLSLLCEQQSFARFSLELLSHLPRFQQIYNTQRAAYRAVNRIRSETHPVPLLSSRHGWIEAPWWVYRSETPARKHLFAKLDGKNLLLSDQAGWQAMIEGPLDDDDAVAQWQEFAVDGVLLRPRALITTMFARLVISDLFMHGIGGGKYDQLTDVIIRDYFGIEPPPMCVATATLHLPLHPDTVGGSMSSNQATLQRELDNLRRLRHHPEEHVSAPDSETQQLLEKKHELLKAIPPRGDKWEWHREITQVNRRLAELNESAIKRGELRLQELAAQERHLKLATSRELSFCLFEMPYVVDALGKLARREFEPPVAK